MKVLLLGSTGMLGQAIKKVFREAGIELYCAARGESEYRLDLLDDRALEQCMAEVRPDVVINAAAQVSLDACELNPGDAYRINARLPGVAAALCRKNGGYFVQISTDHYYCGDGDKKHTEDDPVVLPNEYARTKYAGEQLALTYENSLILRTNIVGFRGQKSPTFLEWALKAISDLEPITLFTDFYTSPMHTVDFARILLDVLKAHPTGVYNLASREACSKKEFVLTLAGALTAKQPNHSEGSVKNLQGAPRGDSLGLDVAKMERLLGRRLPGLSDTIQSIKEEYERRERIYELPFHDPNKRETN